MTKLEMAEILTASPAWGGIKNPEELAKLYSKQELQDALDMMSDSEEEYFNNKYVRPAMSEAQKRAKAKYNSKHRKLQIEFSVTDDAELLRKLSEQPSKQKYIKELIRKDLNLK